MVTIPATKVRCKNRAGPQDSACRAEPHKAGLVIWHGDSNGWLLSPLAWRYW